MTTLSQVVVRVSSEVSVEHQHSHLPPPLPSPLLPAQDLHLASSPPPPLPSHLEIVTAVTFSVGLIQTTVGFLRLGSLSLLINDVIISSFTTGASVHVAISQARHVLGLGSLGVSGPGRIVLSLIALGESPLLLTVL